MKRQAIAPTHIPPVKVTCRRSSGWTKGRVYGVDKLENHSMLMAAHLAMY